MANYYDQVNDTQWKKIQEKTFTRWVNEELKVQKVAVQNLATDLSDGVLLIILLEVLSQKRIGRYNKRPHIHAQKLENLEKVLKFIHSEGIKLVNIGSGDIFEGNLKLILGLIWTLILHYQISMGFENDDEDNGKKKSGKQALLEYIQEKIPHKNIKNFTSDWNDGTAVAALVDAHGPGLCHEADSMDPSKALENASHAMQLADDWLGVPQILGPEDMINPHVDELSMMTYLSQFLEAELKEGAPIHSDDDISTDITKVEISGPGITGDGAEVDKPAPIIVDCSKSGVAPISATVTMPSGITEEVKFQLNDNSENVFEGSYMPKEPGHYGVEVQFNGESLPNSPYQVAIPKPSAIRLDGEGLEHAFIGNEYDNIIDIYTDEAGPGEVTIDFANPVGAGAVKQSIVKVDDNHYQAHYNVDAPGVYEANICYNSIPVKEKPHYIPTIDISKVKVTGPGIESGNHAKAKTHFDVDASLAGDDAPIEVSVTGPDGHELPLDITPLDKNAQRIGYTPTSPGDHVVNVQYADKDIKNSPYFISVDKPGNMYVKCTGKGLTHATANEPAYFVVDTTKAGKGAIGLEMDGPAEIVDIKCEPGDESGIFNAAYVAPRPGAYKLYVKFNEELVPGAPFTVEIGRGDPDASKVIVTDIDTPGSFKINCKNAGGTGHLEVGVSSSYAPADYVAVKHNGDYTFGVSYHVLDSGKTTITVKWHGKDVDGSPFIITT